MTKKSEALNQKNLSVVLRGRKHIKVALENRPSPFAPKACNSPCDAQLKQAVRLIERAGQYQDRGQHEKALPLFIDAATITTNMGAAHEAEKGVCLYLLGRSYSFLGRIKQAKPILELALAMSGSALGLNDTHVADILAELGCLHYRNANFTLAVILLERALVIYRKTCDISDLRVINTRKLLANACKLMGEEATAKR